MAKDSLWPPPCPPKCPNCQFSMTRRAASMGGKHAVLVEALGFWYCYECAAIRCIALGISMVTNIED